MQSKLIQAETRTAQLLLRIAGSGRKPQRSCFEYRGNVPDHNTCSIESFEEKVAKVFGCENSEIQLWTSDNDSIYESNPRIANVLNRQNHLHTFLKNSENSEIPILVARPQYYGPNAKPDKDGIIRLTDRQRSGYCPQLSTFASP